MISFNGKKVTTFTFVRNNTLAKNYQEDFYWLTRRYEGDFDRDVLKAIAVSDKQLNNHVKNLLLKTTPALWTSSIGG